MSKDFSHNLISSKIYTSLLEMKTILEAHTHDLTYLLKMDDSGHYSGRIVEMPAVIVQGKSEDEVEKKISGAALDYFQTFENEHARVIAEEDPIPKMTDSGYGYIVKAKQLQIQC